MAKNKTFNDFEDKKHFVVYVASYGNIAYDETLDAAKKTAAKQAKIYPNRAICVYEAVAFAEEAVTPLVWNDLTQANA